MLGGIHTDLLVTVTLLFLTQTGTQCRAEDDFSLVTLPDWRTNSEYVTKCFCDKQNNSQCEWNQQNTGDVTVLESGPLGMEGEACLEFWYLSPVVANSSVLRVLLNNSVDLTEIWTTTVEPRDSWRQAFVPLNAIKQETQVVIEAMSMEGQFTFNQIGVRRGSCGAQCESNTELWTDESTRCFCSGGQLSCSPSQCPEGQICAPQKGSSGGISASGTCTIHSHTDCSTFDGVLFRFMAPCTYTLAKTCSPSEALPMFSVEVVNERNLNSSLPTVQQVTVSMGKFRVSLLKRQTHRVVVNGVWKKLPLSLSRSTISIKSNPAAVELETSFGLSVSYDSTGAVHVTLPSTYSDKVCGLCGNFNHLSGDDLRKPDGTNAPDATALAESWQTERNTSSCETILVPHQCDPLEEAEYASELYCGGLLSSTGPYAECLSVLGAESYFRDCVVSMCVTHGEPAVLCKTLQMYADTCQEAGVTIPAWRNATFCPLQCGENSHYNSCADGCPEVCSSLDIVGSCGSCEERCVCDSGFKFSGGKCVPAEDCGCWYNGKHYEKGATFAEGECEKECKCMGDDNVQCTAMQCTDNEVCKVKDGVRGCFPFKPATCRVYGDPHYITFDGMVYDFQGGCSYTLTTTCGGESSVQFSVTGHNMHPPLQDITRSKLEAVTLQVDDLHITLNQSRDVYVNNSRVPLNYSTSGKYGTVWVYLKKNYVILETTFGLRLMIDGQNRLFLQVDERYKYELCGLCGTYSDRQDDDLVAPEGQNATGIFEFGDSWKVPGNIECISHPNNPRPCDSAEEDEAYNDCYAILGDAFTPCHEHIHPSMYLNSCVYDHCATSGDQHTFCESLKSYAAACQVAGVELPNWQAHTACAEPPTTAALPTTPTPPSPTPDQTFCPISCDFDRNLCGWEQLIQDSFDWTRHSGPTPSSFTGPDQDHTTGAGFYMYIEGNSVYHGDSARLLSSKCHYNGPVCLHFWYHMYGSATAMALNIYLLKDNRATKVWSMVNNQGPNWHKGNVDIGVSGPFQFIVEGIRGSDAQSDVAIDDISIHFGSCSGGYPGMVSGTESPFTTAEVLPLHPVCSIDCSFNSNLCSWKQMITDAFDWTWHSGSTPTLMTGPSSDHTGDGHYLYIEANSASYGDTARLLSSECSDSGPQCLQFWYHMYGSADTMGLHVYLLQDRLAEAVWWKRNDQGNMWQLAQVDITSTGPFQIIVEGRRGSNEESDVAIDDIKLYQGRCSDLSGDVATSGPDGNTVLPSVPVPTTAGPEPPLVNVTALLPVTAQPPVANVTMPHMVKTTTDVVNTDRITEASDSRPLLPSVCQLNCNFEQDLCQWSQLLTDVFDWTRHRGSTPTMMTGPTSDHTTGDGHYLYIEANSASYGDTARLLSSECSDSGPQCLQFWYNMYGSADTMGLHVYLLQDRLAEAVWWKRNDQGNIWQLAQVDITPTGPFQIIFEGRRGSNDQSDVAIDDISLHRGHCRDMAQPTTPASTTLSPVVTEGPEFPPTISSTTQHQSSTSSKPQPPTVTSNIPTTRPQLPMTTTPITSTQHPEVETSEQPQPPTTARPKPTTSRPQPPTEAVPGPTTTVGPKPTTIARPQPSTEAGPGPTTTVGPGPTITVGPEPTTTVRPQPPTTNRPGPPTTARPMPPTTAGPQPPTEAGPGHTTAVGPEHPTTAAPMPTTTAGPHPPTTATPDPTTTAGPQPPTTDRPQPPTTAKPKPPTTAGSQPTTEAGPMPTTTVGPDHTTAKREPPTTARPQPSTTATPKPSNTTRPQPSTTVGPDHTTAGPEPPTTTKPQPSTEAGPEPTTEVGSDHTTTAGPRPPTTARPQPPTTARPQPQTTARPQPSTTVGPDHTTAGPEPPTTVRPQPSTTAGSTTPVGSEPTTTARPQPTTTTGPRPPTTARPQPPTTARPQPQTTARPQPSTTVGPDHTTAGPEPPTTVRPQPSTTAGSTTPVGSEPTTTARPQPTTTTGPRPPTTARPQPPTTARPQPQTTARPQPSTTVGPDHTTAGPEPPTTARPQPSTEAGPESTTEVGSDHTTTVGPRPPTTARPQPPTTARPQPQTTARPQPSTTVGPDHTTAGPEPPTTVRPQPSTTAGSTTPVGSEPTTTARPQPTTTTGPRPPTTARPQPPTTVRPQPQTTARPQPPTTVRPQPSTTARPQPSTTAGPTTPVGSELTKTVRPQPTTTAGPTIPVGSEPTTTARPQPSTTAGPQPQTTARPQPSTTARPQPSTTAGPQPPTTPVPTPSCPKNSHYNTCVSTCLPTCQQLNGPPRCSDDEGCVQGCVCNEGFVKKGRVCVPIQQCGCVDRNGAKYQFNEVWYTSHCSQKCKCEEDDGVGEIDCDEEDECDENAVCLQNEEGNYNCQFTGFGECTIRDDPEYRTFDKMKHDFDGEHSYVLVRTSNLPNNIPHVYIEGINTVDEDNGSHEHGDSSSEEDHSHRVSEEEEEDDDDDDHHHHRHHHEDEDEDSEEDQKHHRLQELKIRVYGHTVEFKKKRRLVVDGQRTETPASPTAGLKIWKRSSRIYLKTDFGLSVEFDGHSTAEIILPRIYKRKVGGLCGNFDGKKQNELMKPDGTRARSVQEFGESWRV